MKTKRLGRWFDIALIIKGIDGVLEMTGGVLFLMVDPRTIGNALRVLTAHEFSEDPNDRIAVALRRTAASFMTNPSHFAGFFLIGHGLVKVLLVASVLRKQRWAFVPALVFMGVFVVYEVYRLAHSGSLTLLAFTAMDMAVMYFIWREYRALPPVGVEA